VSAEPLKSLGSWGGKEIAFEGAIPIASAGYCFWKLTSLMGAPSMGKPLTDIELAVMLGSMVALVSWAVSRQMFMMGRRQPIKISFFAAAFSLGAVYGLGMAASSGFESSCGEDLGGKIVQSLLFLGEGQRSVCQIGGIPGNGYVPGTLIRPSWSGMLQPQMWIFLVLVSATSSVSLRDKRLRPTKMVAKLYKLLEYAPATGLDGLLGGKSKDGSVQACTNSTFWGEICGQLYPADRKFEPGEWCGRCNQVYTKAERELTFNVVTLFTDNIDLLNMLEKKDTLSWDVPGRIPADGRQSGVERWVVLGQLKVPDVMSVSQLLSISHSMLSQWTSEDERTSAAIELAKKRASKLYGWIWFGRQTKRLTYARPTNKVLMAVGTTRMRDLITDSGDELYLQLDIGLLPVEMRTAFLKTFLDETRKPRFQNSKFDMWVPVAPKLSDNLAGLWVPRVEGNALRKWLSTGRTQEEGKLGVTVPRPYQIFQEEEEEFAPLPVQQAGADPEQEEEEVEEESQVDLTDIFDFGSETPEEVTKEAELEVEEEPTPEPVALYMPKTEDFIDVKVKPGGLDIVRAPFNPSQTEPKLDAITIGGSIAEWDWLEPEQIQLIRQQCLVLVDTKSLRRI
jgi:hypothetical protein